MSKARSNHLIGYEVLLDDFKRAQKKTPKGVSLKRTGKEIYLQFNLTGSRRNKACQCSFTLDGIDNAVSKAKKVADALKKFDRESAFWEWYDKEILEKNVIKKDLILFSEAIELVEDDFWKRSSRTGRKRDRNNPSDISSWVATYRQFYKHLPSNATVNLDDILKVLNKWQSGTKNYKDAISAFKKLARTIGNTLILEALGELNGKQTEHNELQTITLEQFLNWRDEVLGITKELPSNAKLDIRKAWLWVFSVQIVYGLRIHEVFAIKNLNKPFKTKDKTTIPALNDPINQNNLIAIGDKTILGTSTKTSHRLARPLIPPSYPDLIERLGIKDVTLPVNNPKSVNPDTIRKFYISTARDNLIKWKAPFTQTHALRHLGNLNGIQAGISLEVRAQSLGHSPQMNDTVYKKRQHTQTTIDLLLSSNKQAIDFSSALLLTKKTIKKFPASRFALIELLSGIYSKEESEIEGLID